MKKLLMIIAILTLVVTGCSSQTNKDASAKKEAVNKEKASDKAGENKKDKEEAKENYGESDLVEPQEAEQAYEEIEFKNINWWMGSPDLQPNGGIWIYTKEKHPKIVDTTVNWDEKDILLVQPNDPNYINYTLEIKALQIIEEDVVRIIVDLEKKEDDDEKVLPRRYATVEKGQLEGKKFVVETKDGEKVSINSDTKTNELLEKE